MSTKPPVAGTASRPRLTVASGSRYDASVTSGGSVPARGPRCARCEVPITWAGNPHRPFCSLTCRLIDLGVWLDERYRLAGDSMADESEADDRVPSGSG